MSELMEAKRAFVAQVQDEMLAQPNHVHFPLVNHFSHGVYARETHMLAGEGGVGKLHRFPCLNVLAKGHVRVINPADDVLVSEHIAPDVWESPALTQRVIVAVEDSTWVTIHPNPEEERDIAKLEAHFTIEDMA